MENFYTVESGFGPLGLLDSQTLRYYLGLHDVMHDAELTERRGGVKKLYKLERLRAMMELHEKDVIRRGQRKGAGPAGFQYSKLDG